MSEENAQLFAGNDYPPYSVVNRDGSENLLLVCDHASSIIPSRLHQLGLSKDVQSLHIAYDIGASQVAQYISKELNAPLVLARYSRLVIDLNRPLGHIDSIPKIVDNIEIPGNHGLSKIHRSYREKNIFEPYHKMIQHILSKQMRRPLPQAFVSIHSFSPTFGKKPRPWDIGILWKHDKRLAIPLIEALTNLDLVVGNNEPYSGHDLAYTVEQHGEKNAIASCALEINQSHISDCSGIEYWGKLLSSVITSVLYQNNNYKVKKN